MVSLAKMASTSSLISAFTRFVATAMFVKTMIREIQNLIGQMIPQRIQHKLVSFIEGLFRGAISSQMMLVIEESNGITINELYSASEIYLDSTPRITPSMKLLIVHKDPREQRISTVIDKGQRIPDAFDGIKLVWEFAHRESSKRSRDERVERWIRLSFEKEHLDKVLDSYLPYVVRRANAIKEEKRAVRLHTLPHYTKVNLNHPSTFETLAIDPEIKKTLMEDLDRFLKRRDLYRKVGKPWKRGYLLYGPPGTGKSSLVAAMANYLKFDIYDLELTSLRSNSGLKTMLSGTRNRSILVIEDIDCSAEIPTRSSSEDRKGQSSQFTLSGLLNFIDGLWSSCGDERIIVFTTNYKHKLDRALLRPGRMDMHIHMSYCTSSGFRTLASNYHGIKTHRLFDEIDRLLAEVEVTAAEIAEELLKSEDADAAFQGLIGFILKKKEMKCKEIVKVKEEKKKTKKGMQGKDVSKNNATENGKLALLILSLLAVMIASASLILTIVA